MGWVAERPGRISAVGVCVILEGRPRRGHRRRAFRIHRATPRRRSTPPIGSLLHSEPKNGVAENGRDLAAIAVISAMMATPKIILRAA